MRSRTQVIAALTSLLLMTAAARGHPPVATAALVNVNNSGEITITVIHDSLAFALNDTSARIGDAEMYKLLDAPESELASAFADGRDRFQRGFHITADGAELPISIIKSPSVEGVGQWKAEHKGRTLSCKLDFVVSAQLPARAGTLSLRFPEILADTIIIVHRPGVEPTNILLNPGEQSPEIDVRMVGTGNSVNADVTAVGKNASAQRDAPKPPTDQIGALGVAWRYMKLGLNHIIPQGADHCLFVLGLFLLSPRIKPVLWQISSFTIAHTITLTLTSLHIVGVSSRIVEPTIAASIAFVAIENLLTSKVHNWRLVVAFVFGLVHGMGVATAFNEAGFPTGQLVSSLASFTVGVEAGHLTVLAAAFIALSWTRNKRWYRRRVAVPLSLIIAVIAIVWMIQRLSIAA